MSLLVFAVAALLIGWGEREVSVREPPGVDDRGSRLVHPRGTEASVPPCQPCAFYRVDDPEADPYANACVAYRWRIIQDLSGPEPPDGPTESTSGPTLDEHRVE